MGFFKRLLSAGSKKTKKKLDAKEDVHDLRRYHSQTLPVLSEAESEATANRLLRTASSRLGAMRYSAGDEPAPPLPNRECMPPSASSCCNLPFMKLILKSVKKPGLAHCHSFLIVGVSPLMMSVCADNFSAHPLVSPAELNTISAPPPRKQGSSSRKLRALMYLQQGVLFPINLPSPNINVNFPHLRERLMSLQYTNVPSSRVRNSPMRYPP